MWLLLWDQGQARGCSTNIVITNRFTPWPSSSQSFTAPPNPGRGNTLKFCSTQILACPQPKVLARPTRTRHCQQVEMPSLPGLSHSFWIIFRYFRVLAQCPEWQARSTSWPMTSLGPCSSSCSEVWHDLWSWKPKEGQYGAVSEEEQSHGYNKRTICSFTKFS